MRLGRDLSLSLVAICSLGAGSWLLWRNPSPKVSTEDTFPARPALPASPASEPDSEGGLFFAERQIDLGVIKESSVGEFHFENRGPRAIRVLRIQPSCACTITKPDKEIYKPGDKGHLSITIHPNPDRLGRRLYAVDVEYEGSGVHTVRLGVWAQCRPDVVVPTEVAIRSVPGRENKAEFTLVDYREVPLKIERITTSHAELRCQVVEEPSRFLPGWQYRIEASVGLTNRFSRGFHGETITLHTTDPDRKAILVKAVIQRVPRIRLVPESLHLSANPQARGKQTGRVFIDDKEGESLEIESLLASHECLRCQLDRETALGPRLIKVELDESKFPRSHPPLEIRIRLRKPIAEELCVKVLPH